MLRLHAVDIKFARLRPLGLALMERVRRGCLGRAMWRLWRQMGWGEGCRKNYISPQICLVVELELMEKGRECDGVGFLGDSYFEKYDMIILLLHSFHLDSK